VKKIKTNKKLHLKIDTLRMLRLNDLGLVVGGATTSCESNCPERECHTPK
jgi:hypothetical protein